MKQIDGKSKIKERWNKCIGDEDYLKERYKRLYGGGDYENEIEDIRKNNEKRYFLCVFVIVMVFAVVIYSEIREKTLINESDNGFATGIQRDDSGNNSAVELKVYGEKNGKLFTKNVIVDAGAHEQTREETTYKTDEKDGEALLGYRIEEAAREAAEKGGDEIILPSKLSDGTHIYWKKPNSLKGIIVLPLPVLLIYAVYRQRFAKMGLEEKEARESVMKELPGFINRITLLLGAGLVFNSAFEKAITDNSRRRWRNNSYFYSQMRKILENSKSSNISLHKGLEDFARRSQIREFIRITNMISDSIGKGSRLAEKLETESNAIWFARKKKTEEKGRLAESKLIAPLMIMLMILIVITISPAMIEM